MKQFMLKKKSVISQNRKTLSSDPRSSPTLDTKGFHHEDGEQEKLDDVGKALNNRPSFP